MKALLFLSAGTLHRQYKSNGAHNMVDALKMQPLASVGLIAGSCAVIGLPPFPIFAAKLSLLAEIGADLSIGGLLPVLLFLLLAAFSFARLLTRLFGNVSDSDAPNLLERYVVPFGMKFSIIGLMLAIVVLGVFMPPQLESFIKMIVTDLMGAGA